MEKGMILKFGILQYVFKRYVSSVKGENCHKSSSFIHVNSHYFNYNISVSINLSSSTRSF